MYLNTLSQKILRQVKLEEPTEVLIEELKNTSLDHLYDMSTDDQKKAFWINCYNAFFQILRKEYNLTKPTIYRHRQINIADNKFSLDDIEHGILRRNKIKWSLGYFYNPFTTQLLKKLTVAKLDYRIHFALNCGAKSCPPIAFYQPELLEKQLEMATVSFLESETEVNIDKKEIQISRLFQWFKGDFGGTHGIKTILRNHLNISTDGMKLVFAKYNWAEELENFVKD
ncbi:MAG: DUF547 domain-containing protein [Saprospiraceae bacterium]|nr:DUF547 domain-containing protein [Saprospiraceae bacterium]